MPHARSCILLTLALAAPLACTGRTAPLTGLQSIAPSDGGLSEGPIVDAGFLDAGTLDVGDPGPVDAGAAGVCAFAGPYQQNIRISQAPDLPSAYDGWAVLLSRDPLEFELQRGPVLNMFLGNAPLPPDLEPGALVWLQYGTDTPQWTNAAVAIREIAPNDGPGRLRILAWAFGDADVEFDEFDDIELFYETDACSPVHIACGLARTQSLVLKTPEFEGRIPAGEVQSFRAMQVGNGQSHRYAPAPECSDTPSFWHAGYLARF